MYMNNTHFIISEKIEKDLSENKPVVAIESSIISQGMPYPENLNTITEVVKIIEAEGCTPAIIAIIDGKILVGLSEKQIEFLAKGKELLKVSKQNLSYAVANKLSGGTTVSASIFLAQQAGIDVFVTGGIGGVHKDFTETFDLSQDLDELSKTDIVVVSSGAKSIVDLNKTVEYLETKSVLILGYQINQFPAFYSKDSGITIPYVVNTPDEIANVFLSQKNLGIESAILIANPIPDEHNIPFEQIERIIEKALKKAKAEKVIGKALTPFLLNEISKETGGKSLQANIALFKNNAVLAASIAKEIVAKRNNRV